ncbi:MAG: hypothetical protein NVSMB70_08530 [Chamaesiphon sp.]
MLYLPGYRITSKIYESANSLVYRGVRELDLQPLSARIRDYAIAEPGRNDQGLWDRSLSK